MIIEFKKTVPHAIIPVKVDDTDNIYNLYCSNIQYYHKYNMYHTGISINIPSGYLGFVIPNDQVINKDLMLKNSISVIKPNDNNEIILKYTDIKQYTAVQKKDFYELGDIIGQLLIIKISEDITLNEVEEF